LLNQWLDIQFFNERNEQRNEQAYLMQPGLLQIIFARQTYTFKLDNMTAEVNQPGEIQFNNPPWDVENEAVHLFSSSFNGHGIHRIQNLFLSYIVDWQLTNEGED
jgi:hypothetical protein